MQARQRDKLLPVFKLLGQNVRRRVTGAVHSGEELFLGEAADAPSHLLVAPDGGRSDECVQIEVGGWKAPAMINTILAGGDGGRSRTQVSRQDSGIQDCGCVSWKRGGRSVRVGGGPSGANFWEFQEKHTEASRVDTLPTLSWGITTWRVCQREGVVVRSGSKDRIRSTPWRSQRQRQDRDGRSSHRAHLAGRSRRPS